MSTPEDYDIGQSLGRGGFANVFRAKNRSSRENVAIKMICKSKIEELGLHERVRNEIRIHSKLHHHHIVQYKTHFETTSHVYIVMESCSHGNLYRYFKKQGRLSESDAAYIVSQLLKALEYLHSIGIVHRDLKLSNIILNQNLEVKICDFGLAIQLEHPDEEHFTICGTPNYIAPEIASQKSHGCPADLWSIGCLFYSLVTGIMPFEHSDGVKETLQNIIGGHYEQPTGVSPTALDFLNCLLDLNPNTRANAGNMRKHPFIKEIISSATSSVSSPARREQKEYPVHYSVTPIRMKRSNPLQFESPSSAITEYTDATAIDEYHCPMDKSNESDDVTARLHHASPLRPARRFEEDRDRRFHQDYMNHRNESENTGDMYVKLRSGGQEELARATGAMSPVFCEEPNHSRSSNGSFKGKLHGLSHLMYDDDDDVNGTTLYSSHEFRESLSLMRSSEDGDDSSSSLLSQHQHQLQQQDEKNQAHQPQSYLDSILQFRAHGQQLNRMSIQSSESLSRLTLPSLLFRESDSFKSSETGAKEQQRQCHDMARKVSVSSSSSSSPSSLLSSYPPHGSSSSSSSLLQSWIDPNLTPFAHSNKAGDVLIVAKNGDILFCTRLSTRVHVDSSTSTAATDENEPFRFCVRSETPHVLHIGEMDQVMLTEMQRIVDQRYNRKNSATNPLDRIQETGTNQRDINRYNEHLESSNLDEAVCFSRKTVNAARGIYSINTDQIDIDHRTIDYDSLKLLGSSMWKKAYNIYSPSVPRSVRIIYSKVGEMLQETKPRIPKLVVYLNVKTGDNNGSSGNSSSANTQGSYIYCKCMLMANGTLPDFRVQWIDKTKLRYSLHTGRMHITGPKVGSLRWQGQGGMDDESFSWLNASDKVKEYLLLSQEMMKRCISIDKSGLVENDGNASVHFEEVTEEELILLRQGGTRERGIADGNVRESSNIMNYHPYASAPSPPPEEKSSDIGDDYLYSDQIASQSQPPSLGEGEEEIIFASNNTAVTDNVEDTSSQHHLCLSLEQQ